MTATTQAPVEQIVAILENSKAFRRIPAPLKIGNVPFEFSAVLIGQDKNPDLVIVIDTIAEDIQRTRQKIGGLGRALDVVGSRRPVTAILTGPRPADSALESISKICRVLPVGTPTGTKDEELLRDWLSVLLPLPIAPQTGIAADPLGELIELLPAGLDPELKKSVVEASPHGADTVKRELKRRLTTPFDIVEKKLENGEGDQ
ncbi:hypothetical protein FY148_10440 [Agrobacterium tumefaciens]|uniref:hypothetical protein n=1 Tax=Agrobacterium tumefaciens TaxID=358 RepID=UPI0021D30B0A|nr:hypothetical protein [Agrobacterium tumefaciens]UXS53040.1 hypothetical protein FY148_10440 [Agrobacterium tumefaciens]UXS63284.1 hypothetical protein FY147_10440 [Agrobacterium tumefaciens]